MLFATNYYVNDNSTSSDIYCSAVGNDANNGTSGATPKATVGSVLSTYALAAGDIVYIDTGNYTESVTITSADGVGAVNNPVLFRGNPAMTTVFSGTNSRFIIQASCSYITLAYLTLTTTDNNHVVQTTTNTSSNIVVTYCNLNLTQVGATTGCIQFQGNSNQVDHNTITSKGFGVRFQNSNSNTCTDNTIINAESNVNAIAMWLENSSNNAMQKNLCYCSAAGAGKYGIQFASSSTNGNYYNNAYSNYENGLFCTDAGSTGNNFYFCSIYSTKTCCYGVYSGWTLQNNIYYTSSASGTEYCIYVTSNSSFDPTTLNYNIYYHPNGAICANRNGTTYATFANFQNQFSSNGVAASNESNGIGADPKYNAPGSNDLSLQSSSPAIDVALNYNANNNDILNKVRPAGSARDIGAYEYGAHFLPVELVEFNGKCSNNLVTLKWTTASEKNNDYFEVEQSEDGKNFYPAQVVKGHGNSRSYNYYQYSDDSPFKSQVKYYRLKQVDFDGSYNFSSVIPVTCLEKDVSLVILPQLISKENAQFTLTYSGLGEKGNLEIYNSLGQVVYSRLLIFENTGSLTVFPTKLAASGSYYVRVNVDGQSYSQKILVY